MPKTPCVVDIGAHMEPYWLEKNSKQIYCGRHRMQMEELASKVSVYPYDWENVPQCLVCGGFESDMWWKCCPKHTTQQGIEVVGECCLRALHPPKLVEDVD